MVAIAALAVLLYRYVGTDQGAQAMATISNVTCRRRCGPGGGNNFIAGPGNWSAMAVPCCCRRTTSFVHVVALFSYQRHRAEPLLRLILVVRAAP